MSASKTTHRSQFDLMTGGMKLVAAIILALTLSLTGVLVGAAASSDSAYAAIYAVDESAQSASADDEAAAVDSEAADGETIADDENPMSSGLDDAMIASNTGIPLYAYAILGIVVVAVFFFVSTGKLNSNISKMNRSIR